MDERLRFVARLLEGEKMAVLCREFDISRKTGYKIFTRYKDCGLEGLTDRSRRPYRQANRLPFQIETLIVQLKQEHPSWGAPKIREKLRRRQPRHSAAGDQHGTRGARSSRPGQPRRRRSLHAEGTTLSTPARRTIFGARTTRASSCSPTSATAIRSPSPTSPAATCSCCDALATTKELYAFTVFERAFKDFGLPRRSAPTTACPSRAQLALRPEQALGLVATPGHAHRAHQARQPAAERSARAHAPDAEEGSHQARRQELPAAASEVRSLHRVLQPGAARTRR